MIFSLCVANWCCTYVRYVFRHLPFGLQIYNTRYLFAVWGSALIRIPPRRPRIYAGTRLLLCNCRESLRMLKIRWSFICQFSCQFQGSRAFLYLEYILVKSPLTFDATSKCHVRTRTRLSQVPIPLACWRGPSSTLSLRRRFPFPSSHNLSWTGKFRIDLGACSARSQFLRLLL